MYLQPHGDACHQQDRDYCHVSEDGTRLLALYTERAWGLSGYLGNDQSLKPLNTQLYYDPTFDSLVHNS